MRSEAMKRILVTIILAAGCLPAAHAAVDDDVRSLQTEWAQIKYVAPAADQEKSFEKLTQAAAALRERYPTRAEPAIWYGIIAGSYAGAKGGLGALSLAKEAKKAFEDALAIDRNALDGSAYTSLGSLYYMVPGWPVGFGDDKKALEMLEAGLALNPAGIDANFFMGDYLFRKGDYAGARAALTKALAAPPRPGRAVADEGGGQEIEARLVKVREKAG
jgi:tetratricopeptide (TPR) repeat protein